ncbi:MULTISPECIES: thioesterase family protein [unclassified Mesorhizobium]|uniref:thioesterase family protein n=1 Tax=unclassified Mesorhizobium TaxID=325217 RepID=UPI000FCC6E93|nr:MULTISPECIES: thioesterase family protein [unclassified Mesorhizobium]TIT77585.1 MAG: thioesterase [Mesorhizobium sp.]TGP20544.1 thioesterase [Mesorhizobium sp. M1D.F.Ca.ET.231.01.1.1]TGP28541.1 thioesterase [Mesorhizobium sp. M1D.F.Ca.ET.234.01.1.1]TGS42689.1 thioesterase [Mesorhizobium sp. M1D.F.Ca.ET.184.01.1.1]TGS59739.1 thioesterase [Mesorhizobium sp. M1D.F.Ca.ET.183.01.1.1]
MYVWGRLARMTATARSRGPYVVGEQSRLAFRCLPTDIDFNGHLNNARYMMLADLGRIDVFLRIGLVALARRNGWAPMIGGLQVAYAREIRLWRRFEVMSSIETWEGTSVIGRHRFVLDNGETAALIKTTGGVYDRRGRRFLEIDEVAAALGRSAAPRPPTEAERMFMASHQTLRRLAKGPP